MHICEKRCNMSLKRGVMGHLEIFQRELKEKKVEACLIENPIDLFYLTGLHVSEGSLIVTPKSAKLFVDGRYTVMAKANAALPVGEKEKMAAYLKSRRCKRVVFDASWTSYQRVLELKKIASMKGVDHPLKGCRNVKDKKEILKLKASAALLWKGFLEMRRSLKVGVSERDVARCFEMFCLKYGAEGLGFESIVAFGPHSAMPHHRSGKRKLRANDVVLIDIGVVVDGYHSDMTRMVFFGEPKPKMRKIYELVHGAQKAALKLCRPGVKLKVLDEAVRAVFRKAKFLKYYPHGLGHGVGLEVHEFPRASYKGADKEVKLEPGMVFTVEPGIYLPGEFGVRYEDTIVITKDGFENFYRNMNLIDTII